MLTLFLIIIAVGAFFLLRKIRRLRKEHQVRYSPPPKRSFIEVSLPRGMNDSERRMQNFYRKIASVTTPDPKARMEGKGQIDIIYYAEVKPGHLAPDLRFLISCDPDKLSMVKRALKSSFDKQTSITPVDGDPFADVIEALLAEQEDEDAKNEQEKPKQRFGFSAE